MAQTATRRAAGTRRATHWGAVSALVRASVMTGTLEPTVSYVPRAHLATRVKSAATTRRAQIMGAAARTASASARWDGLVKHATGVTQTTSASSATCTALGILHVEAWAAVGLRAHVSVSQALEGPGATCAWKACGDPNVIWGVRAARMEEDAKVGTCVYVCPLSTPVPLHVRLAASSSLCLSLSDSFAWLLLWLWLCRTE